MLPSVLAVDHGSTNITLTLHYTGHYTEEED